MKATVPCYITRPWNSTSLGVRAELFADTSTSHGSFDDNSLSTRERDDDECTTCFTKPSWKGAFDIKVLLEIRTCHRYSEPPVKGCDSRKKARTIVVGLTRCTNSQHIKSAFILYSPMSRVLYSELGTSAILCYQSNIALSAAISHRSKWANHKRS